MSARKKVPAFGKQKSSFHLKVDSKDRAVVLFYATWCPFSQAFLPVFKEYPKRNLDECLSVIADEEPIACEEYYIEFYPTVIIFQKGKVHKRLDAEPHVGLSKKQFTDFTGKE